MADQFECRISKHQISSGCLYIPTRVRPVFPKGYDKAEIHVIFDDEEEPRSLTYDPYNHIVWGLRNWHNSHGAKIGDLVIVEPLAKDSVPPSYRFRFEKQTKVPLPG